MLLRVLLVCSANVCRSPLLEALLRAGSPGSALMFDSAGTEARTGESVDPRMVALATGVDPAWQSHTARRLDDISLDRRDLILTAERQHRRVVVQRNPRLSKRTFTVREFARLASAAGVREALVDARDVDDRARLTRVLSRLRAARTTTFIEDADDDDLADPHGRSDAEYRRCWERALESTGVIGHTLDEIVAR